MTSTPSSLSTALFFLSAMSVAGIVHVLWLKSSLSQPWRQPIDFGKTIRGRRVFGDNKMLRGFMVLPVAAALSFAILSFYWPNNISNINESIASVQLWQLLALGFASGLGFMIGELPNSFIKRQLDIAPGTAASTKTLQLVFGFLDRIDSTIVALLFASLVIPLTIATCLWVLVFGFVIHAFFSFTLHRLGVKGRAL